MTDPVPGAVGPVDRRGLLYGASAYVLWGAMPLYFPLLDPARPLEIIAHRIVWSLVVCVGLLLATRALGRFVEVLRTPRALGLLAVAGVLVATNWTIYVYGVLSGHVLDAALGYFVNPLVTVLLAVLVLRERLRPAQWVALATGAAAVAVISAGVGRVPWIALGVAFSFGLYGLVKNRTGRSVEALPGLAAETTTLAPLALGYLVWLGATGTGTFTTADPAHALLLASSGLVTAVPLLLFSSAARRIPLSLVGMLQYLAPVLQFLCGLLVFHEQMPPARWVGFGLVWVALVVLSVDGLHAARATRLATRA
ncbi:EamA family transporter RarD [Cellulosimicrobium marinum]|uniref:EamA family transporter RarD n=1 Tax=Cellulosimicrobium marinum TaxID=1638992 RepID=UPI001E3C9DC7|nr:EamA family transporter RarD [Cellulosimicrobium marinum]MCB7136820.1 EamA family transporter RarD [Cellulosimicrobium marinum]